MTLVSQLEITHICITGDKEHVRLHVCVSFGQKPKLRVQPVKLQGITALIILASTVECKLQQLVKKTVEIPDDKLGKYMMKQQMVSLFSSARLTG